MKFRKKPVVVEAVQFLPNKESADELMSLALTGTRAFDLLVNTKGEYSLFIYTLEGKMEASIGDWIIKGVNGEIYPCKPDIFWKTYETVE